MSQNLNSVPPFDGTNYGYWKARMRFFLKSIDVWKIVETGWIKPEETDEITVIQTSARLSNDKALHALCQTLSPSEFSRISHCEIALDASAHGSLFEKHGYNWHRISVPHAGGHSATKLSALKGAVKFTALIAESSTAFTPEDL
mgnify:CR=1 FL=1